MIVCPNCNHQNPEGATQCEACYTPLPTTMACPSCGATIQSDAAFCGQCGYNLQPTPTSPSLEEQEAALPTVVSPPSAPVTPEPLVTPEPVVSSKIESPVLEKSNPDPARDLDPDPDPVGVASVANINEINPTPSTVSAANTASTNTQLQNQSAHLLHIQTNLTVELPPNLPVIHIGKPNELVPPDIDVSGFPSSEVVSRTHADIRVEGGFYYIEDVGSSNGTYVNNIPLTKGNRHLLRPGDRISLGKGDLVSFIFQQPS
ncbi:FHA domain-containing protein [Lyngbya sp. PCC 8106]|uniref:FHA domain-containing protein n=1 Tax=Lyngbya sp. (strain PCC 8106) TaxID=313612 RepID=UPI0000EAD75F|nr:FHA domain-containing protein [Lyngbya sp. PCC 8106]EAW37691.1 FHA domain containing protein [Lyngbya sp. PCC 8106]